MTKEQIRQKYWDYILGYETCLDMLVDLGMTESAADDYLFEKGNLSQDAGHAGTSD